jgi:hypothetical protein
MAIVQSSELCYLVHPATSYGDYKGNKEDSIKLQNEIQRKYKFISILNPIASVNENATWSQAMDICKLMIDICTSIILSPGWEKSKGCRKEVMWAIREEKFIYIICYNKEDGIVQLEFTTPKCLLSKVVL